MPFRAIPNRFGGLDGELPSGDSLCRCSGPVAGSALPSQVFCVVPACSFFSAAAAPFSSIGTYGTVSSRVESCDENSAAAGQNRNKNRVIEWGPAQQRSFNALKTALITAPVLRLYDRKLKPIMVTDACTNEQTIGGSLMQDDGDGRPLVAYYSWKLTEQELWYTTREKELIAIKECLRVWRHYLLGTSFDVHCDHESLKYFRTMPDLSDLLLRWLEFLE
eukprot:1017405-Rhodomonas_salina.1